MQVETFRKGLELIVQVFSKHDIEAEVYWQFLSDLNDSDFLAAVEDFCKTQKEIYPGTNPIAIIRELAMRKNSGPNLLGLPEGERFSSPPPPEFKVLVKKLAEEKSVK